MMSDIFDNSGYKVVDRDRAEVEPIPKAQAKVFKVPPQKAFNHPERVSELSTQIRRSAG